MVIEGLIVEAVETAAVNRGLRFSRFSFLFLCELLRRQPTRVRFSPSALLSHLFTLAVLEELAQFQIQPSWRLGSF